MYVYVCIYMYIYMQLHISIKSLPAEPQQPERMLPLFLPRKQSDSGAKHCPICEARRQLSNHQWDFPLIGGIPKW